jgi:uncharacterized delta-60 repeat protein
MKKSLPTLFCFVVYIHAFSQIQQNINIAFQAPQYFDLTFGTNGVALFDTPENPNSIYGIATQSDGKILAVTSSNNIQYYLMRLNADGSLDSTFGQNGIIEDTLIGEALGGDVQVDEQDRIIITGYVYHSFGQEDLFVVRLLPDGTYDNSFGVNGVFIAYTAELWPANKHSYGKKIKLLNDGSILVGGNFSYQENDFDVAVYKITPDGQFDQSFGVNGYVYYQISGHNTLRDIDIQSDGKILMTGHAFNPVLVPVLRLNSDGSLDTTFGNNGKALHDFMLAYQYGVAVKQLSNQKILVAGTKGPTNSQLDIFLYRLDENGLIDSSFGNNGFAIFDNGFSEGVNSMQLLPNGDILLLGADSHGNGDFLLACFDSTGMLKTNFLHNGKLNIDLNGNTEGMSASCIQSDGKILFVGLTSAPFWTSGNISFVRLNLFNSSLNELSENESQFKVFPNPASDQLTISFKEKHPNTKCLVLDHLGKEVLCINISNGDHVLDIHSLEKGLYIVQINSESFRFVKN